MRRELEDIATNYGDPRRSPIVAREEARAYSETELMSTDPITVVLSKKGWIRAAKGHEVEPENLSYKSGDGFLAAAQGRSNQAVLLLDSSGRAYSLPAHTLPSARGQGEPLTGRLNPPSGAEFRAVLMGDDQQRVLLASDAGYGFVARLSELHGKNRAGKAVVNLPKGAHLLPPVSVNSDTDNDASLVVAISNEGRLLAFPLSELPELNRGKGNRIINIPASRLQTRDEYLNALEVLSPCHELVVHSGKRHLSIKYNDLDHYRGERGRRGSKLPRGFQRVDRIELR